MLLNRGFPKGESRLQPNSCTGSVGKLLTFALTQFLNLARVELLVTANVVSIVVFFSILSGGVNGFGVTWVGTEVGG